MLGLGAPSVRPSAAGAVFLRALKGKGKYVKSYIDIYAPLSLSLPPSAARWATAMRQFLCETPSVFWEREVRDISDTVTTNEGGTEGGN